MADKKVWTPEEYLAFDRDSDEKYEFYQCEIFSQPKARRKHNLIVTNLLSELRNALRDRPCETYPPEMRVKLSPAGLYTYPDVSVVSAEPEFADETEDTLLNPRVICEVLSDSSESYDRGQKFELYRTLPSLMDYVLLSQKQALIEHFTRQADDSWLLREVRSGQVLKLTSIGCEIAANEIYLKIFSAAVVQ